jgi:hypothetical protein
MSHLLNSDHDFLPEFPSFCATSELDERVKKLENALDLQRQQLQGLQALFQSLSVTPFAYPSYVD